MRFTALFSTLLSFAVAALVIACGDVYGPRVHPPTGVTAVSGDAQPASEVGLKLAKPLVVRVFDERGQNLYGVTVTWQTATGTLADSSSVTDINGMAKMEWTLGPFAGNQSATATVSGLKPVQFKQTAIAGPFAQIILTRDTVHLLAVGDVFQLRARAADRFGNFVSVRTTVQSEDPSIVTADNFLNGTGAVLTARASGKTTTIRATAESIVKMGTVIVLPPPCQPGTNGLNLAVGEATVLSGIAASEFCVQGTAAGAEFVAIPFFSDFSGSQLRLSILAGSSTTGLASRQSAQTLQLEHSFSRQLKKDEAFEAELRERSLVELTPLIPSARAARRENAGKLELSLAGPQIGDLLQLNTNAFSACTNAKMRTGRVAAITARAIIVTDTSNPPNGFTAEDYQHFGSIFDTLVYPVDTTNFGAPSDLDNNQRVILFFTRAVNELTPPGRDFYVSGYFFNRDLFPVTTAGSVQGCPASNVGEMFYLLVPDPNGMVNQNVRTVDFVKTVILGTLAHEFQHLINASRRLYVNTGSSTFEDLFLDEGLAHIAEELTFYRASGLTPGQNISYQTIQSTAKTQSAFDGFGAANFLRYREYLTNPAGTSPYVNNADITTRGAIWSFLRYAADRRGGSEKQLWFDLANPPPGVGGVSNITRAVTADLGVWVRDWTVANYADDFIAGIQAIDSHPSWNTRSMVSAVNEGGWPLSAKELDTTTITSLNVSDGSAAYLHFGVAANTVGGGRITARGAPVPSGFTLTILRTR
jgi:hypothetical protein